MVSIWEEGGHRSNCVQTNCASTCSHTCLKARQPADICVLRSPTLLSLCVELEKRSWSPKYLQGKHEVLDNPSSLPVGRGSRAFSICEPLALLQCLGCELPPAEPVSLHSYWEDWNWTMEMYPTSVLFSWPRARSIPLTQEGNCWLLNLLRNLYSIIDFP